MGLGMVIYHSCCKYYRVSVAIKELHRSENICSQQINITDLKLQRSDNIKNP
jgi:hypothetical protein